MIKFSPILFLISVSTLSFSQRLCKKADSLFVKQRYSEAVFFYSEAIASKEASDNAYSMRGQAKTKLVDYRGAIEDFKTYLISVKGKEFDKANLKDVQLAYFNLGLSYSAIGNRDAACLSYSKAGEFGYPEAYEAIKVRCK